MPNSAVNMAILFGKLPTHGDFVSRGLSHEGQNFWDEAISISLSLSRLRFGESFEALYGQAAPWRCLVRDAHYWLAGALAPSMDRAGRLFPILAARRLETHEAGSAVAAACEDLLFEALSESWTVDDLYSGVCAIGESYISEPREIDNGWWLDGYELLGKSLPTLDGLLPQSLLSEMLAVTEQLA